MKQQFDSDTLAKLSKLSPSDATKETVSEQLGSILEYVGSLQKIDTSHTTHAHTTALTSETLRTDVAASSDETTRNLIIENFPHRKGDLLKAPEVFE